MKFRKISLILIVLMMFTMIGCNQNEAVTTVTDDASTAVELSYEGNFKIVLPNETIELAYNDIYAMEPTTATYKTITSSGEELTSEVIGVSLNDLLKANNTSLKDFTGVRGVAGDGYAIDVPGEIIADKDILLIWSENGEAYDEKKMPLRMAINDERAMYWVSNLKEIHCLTGEFVNEESSIELSQIVFLEAAAKNLEAVDITYYETDDKGINVPELFDTITTSDPVTFIATDNFEKTEKLEVLNQGLIKMTGENAPLFMSPDLPKGMHVKFILQLHTGNTAFVSEMNALEVYSKMTVEDTEGVSVMDIIDQAGLKADSYIFTSTDGYAVELSGKAVKKGILSKDGDIYKVQFDGQPKNTTIKDVYSISVSEETKVVVEESTDTSDVVLSPWGIEFKGLADGSFVFTNEKAERKLELITLTATKTSKDGASYEQEWQGYRLKDVLDFLHVEDFEELLVVASDGYEITYTKDQVDENMILGVIVDGEAISEDKGSVQLVSSSLTSNFWAKYIVTVELK